MSSGCAAHRANQVVGSAQTHGAKDTGDCVTAYVGLGSNLGNRLGMMRAAVSCLRDRLSDGAGLAIGISSLYETAPVGVGPQHQPFLNAAIRLSTRLSARSLLEMLLDIEASLGRSSHRQPHGGHAADGKAQPRLIDLDLLLYGQGVIETSRLILPHPRLHLRRFVLEPLAEIGKQTRHPLLDRSMEALRDAARREAESGQWVRKVRPFGWEEADGPT